MGFTSQIMSKSVLWSVTKVGRRYILEWELVKLFPVMSVSFLVQKMQLKRFALSLPTMRLIAQSLTYESSWTKTKILHRSRDTRKLIFQVATTFLGVCTIRRIMPACLSQLFSYQRWHPAVWIILSRQILGKIKPIDGLAGTSSLLSVQSKTSTQKCKRAIGH